MEDHGGIEKRGREREAGEMEAVVGTDVGMSPAPQRPKDRKTEKRGGSLVPWYLRGCPGLVSKSYFGGPCRGLVGAL
jgi:hypothetical protein